MPTIDQSRKLHLAIIPDGNRRWAREKKLEAVWRGHEVAIENFRTLTKWCRESGKVSVLTVWCFSTENWRRDPKEISMLMTMLEKYLVTEASTLIKEGTRFVHSGRRDRLPKGLVKIIEETEESTKNCTEFILHLAVDYGGKDEVLRGIQRLLGATKNQEITEKHFRTFLDHPEIPDIDLVLRSSGEHRTSNFFLFQTAYAEWIFSPKYFPDIGTKDIEAALEEYVHRKRRFGG